MAARNRFIRRIAYGVYLFLAVFLLLEIALRIYDPFHFRLKGDRILLPVNQKATIVNRINPKLDPVIVNTRNSLGFRGPELPRDTTLLLRVIAIGGSTTECHFLGDDRTWPFLLGKKLGDSFPRCWMNNAGLDGHSTYGHIILLNDEVKRLKPSVILFLTGINDVETESPTFHDRLNTRGAVADWRHYLFQNSEVLNVILNLCRGWRAQRFNNTTHTMMVLDPLKRKELPDSVTRERLARQAPFLEGYKSRLEQLADTCLAWHILPVFLTQPNQFGEGRDPVTGADLELYPTDGADVPMNGRLIWQMLEQYNGVTRAMCAEKKLPLIDLARLMPKDSRYFYDMSHFTNVGAEEVSGLLSGPLSVLVREYLPQYGR
jgi:hypothetical protein